MIVPADPSHLDAAWAIIARCRTSLRERRIHQWDDLYPTREIAAADIANARMFVLLSSGRPQAVVSIDETPDDQYATVSWTTAEPALIVHRLCVDPAAQGHGLAGQLMDHVEAYARQHRFASIRLDAFSGNPAALRLYRGRGYREAGQVFFPRRALPFPCFELNLRSSTRAADV